MGMIPTDVSQVNLRNVEIRKISNSLLNCSDGGSFLNRLPQGQTLQDKNRLAMRVEQKVLRGTGQVWHRHLRLSLKYTIGTIARNPKYHHAPCSASVLFGVLSPTFSTF